jgi:hypothetical protein
MSAAAATAIPHPPDSRGEVAPGTSSRPGPARRLRPHPSGATQPTQPSAGTRSRGPRAAGILEEALPIVDLALAASGLHLARAPAASVLRLLGNRGGTSRTHDASPPLLPRHNAFSARAHGAPPLSRHNAFSGPEELPAEGLRSGYVLPPWAAGTLRDGDSSADDSWSSDEEGEQKQCLSRQNAFSGPEELLYILPPWAAAMLPDYSTAEMSRDGSMRGISGWALAPPLHPTPVSRFRRRQPKSMASAGPEVGAPATLETSGGQVLEAPLVDPEVEAGRPVWYESLR